MMTIRLPAFLMLMSSLVVPLTAQEGTPMKVELRFLALGSDMKLSAAFAQDPAAPAEAVSIPVVVKDYLNDEFSSVSLAGRKLAFTSKADRASLTREGELIAETTLPEGTRSAVLLFLPGQPGGKAKNRIMVINDSRRAFPPGSYHATNLSSLPVRITLENTNYDFKPGQVILIENPPVRENNHSGMHTSVFRDNKWLPVSSGLWPHPGSGRGILILYPDMSSGLIQIRAFNDSAPRDAAAVPAP